MKYLEIKQKHREQVDAFPVQFAFNEQQVREGLERLGVDSIKDVVSTGHGGLIRKSDTRAFTDMFIKQAKTLLEACKDEGFLTEALVYELSNHEYNISRDDSSTKDVFKGVVDFESDHFKNCMNKAKAIYKKEQEQYENKRH